MHNVTEALGGGGEVSIEINKDSHYSVAGAKMENGPVH